MNQSKRVRQEIEKRCHQLFEHQSDDGAWHYCFEGALMTDAYMIILLRTLNLDEGTIIRKLADRLRRQQQTNGTWQAHPDEPSGNLSATTEAYMALLYSGYVDQTEPAMKKAAAYIRAQGGLKKTGVLTRLFLAMNGHYPWPILPVNPAIVVLLPAISPVDFYSLSSYARAHFAPALLAIEHQFSKTSQWTPDLNHLNKKGLRSDQQNDYWPEIQTLSHGTRDRRSFFSNLKDEWYKLNQLPNNLKTKPDRWIEDYILSRIEPNGTLLNYASSTFFMIYGLMAMGYAASSPIIQKAVDGLKGLIWDANDAYHVQNSPSTVWDTGLISYTLLESGIKQDHPGLLKAADYLLNHQQQKYSDWAIHAPKAEPGGWGFSPSNTLHPDMDDTQTVLRTIEHYAKQHQAYHTAYQEGVHWLLSMQNSDGGWAAFERNTDQYFLALLPIKHMRSAAIDPATPDLTGRTLQYLGKHLQLDDNHPKVKAAIKWLKQRQEGNGSWYGRWGVCYIYGTWAAVSGLASVSTGQSNAEAIQRAVKWLTTIQNEDGGWGESCRSDVSKSYVPLSQSTPVQTAWAVDTLIAASEKSHRVIENGIHYLLNATNVTEEATNDPTGVGLPGQFYIRYHSYQYIWPLLALAHYYNKFGKN
ncbi:squalene--hopene cyclase [Tuberibacillus sp. Marseille-P3662]|uniref:squalene--hopene cyclase n=1 Tax=Tuberibacillus sp. Marseille-P3662 TaxID=1965358 RepID=UPI001593849A|nr:squalene--hopene cyclase [Tuberibacillus sp. Marseille-P3662]